MALPSHQWSVLSAGSGISNNGNFSGTLENDIIVESLALFFNTSPGATVPDGYTQISDVTVGTLSGDTIRMITAWRRIAADSEGAGSWSGISGYRFFTTTNIRGCKTTGNPFEFVDDGISTGSSLSMALSTSNYTDIMVLHHMATERDFSGEWMGARANAQLSSLTEQTDLCLPTSGGCGRGAITGTRTAVGSLGTTTVATTTDNMTWLAIPLQSTTSTTGGGNNGGFFAFF